MSSMCAGVAERQEDSLMKWGITRRREALWPDRKKRIWTI